MKILYHFIVPTIILFIAFMLDGVFATHFFGVLQTPVGYIIPRLTLMLLISFGLYLTPSSLYLISFLFGFLYDSYYLGIVGVYLPTFLLISYLILQFRKFLKPNLLNNLLIGILILIFSELMVYFILNTIGFTQLSIGGFFIARLGISLLVNILALSMLIYGFQWIKHQYYHILFQFNES